MKDSYYGITGKNSKSYSILFFMIGLIGAVGFRIVLIVNKFSSVFASLVWYIATISYIFFYLYRHYIEQRRVQILVSTKLKYKLDNDLGLSEKDKNNLRVIVDSLLVSKQNLNLIILVVASFVSLITQIVLDLVLK